MPANLQPVAAVYLVIGMVDHVGREPQDFALKLAQHRERRAPVAASDSRNAVLHGGL